jgi:hypothetical protein
VTKLVVVLPTLTVSVRIVVTLMVLRVTEGPEAWCPSDPDAEGEPEREIDSLLEAGLPVVAVTVMWETSVLVSTTVVVTVASKSLRGNIREV